MLRNDELADIFGRTVTPGDLIITAASSGCRLSTYIGPDTDNTSDTPKFLHRMIGDRETQGNWSSPAGCLLVNQVVHPTNVTGQQTADWARIIEPDFSIGNVVLTNAAPLRAEQYNSTGLHTRRARAVVRKQDPIDSFAVVTGPINTRDNTIPVTGLSTGITYNAKVNYCAVLVDLGDL